jgi:DNA-directed RNA polymerase subunit F
MGFVILWLWKVQLMSSNNDKHTRLASISEALETLETRKKDGDLGYEQTLAYEHAKKFAKLDTEKGKKMAKELEGLGLSAKAAVSIADTMPIDMLQLKQILANEKKTVEPETAEKAMAIIEKHRGK